MSTETKTEKTSAKPAMIAYQIREGKGDKRYWNRIGVAFANKDGKGFNLQIESFPHDGKITLRIPTEKKQ